MQLAALLEGQQRVGGLLNEAMAEREGWILGVGGLAEHSLASEGVEQLAQPPPVLRDRMHVVQDAPGELPADDGGDLGGQGFGGRQPIQPRGDR